MERMAQLLMERLHATRQKLLVYVERASGDEEHPASQLTRFPFAENTAHSSSAKILCTKIDSLISAHRATSGTRKKTWRQHSWAFFWSRFGSLAAIAIRSASTQLRIDHTRLVAFALDSLLGEVTGCARNSVGDWPKTRLNIRLN